MFVIFSDPAQVRDLLRVNSLRPSLCSALQEASGLWCILRVSVAESAQLDPREWDADPQEPWASWTALTREHGTILFASCMHLFRGEGCGKGARALLAPFLSREWEDALRRSDGPSHCLLLWERGHRARAPVHDLDALTKAHARCMSPRQAHPPAPPLLAGDRIPACCARRPLVVQVGEEGTCSLRFSWAVEGSDMATTLTLSCDEEEAPLVLTLGADPVPASVRWGALELLPGVMFSPREMRELLDGAQGVGSAKPLLQEGRDLTREVGGVEALARLAGEGDEGEEEDLLCVGGAVRWVCLSGVEWCEGEMVCCLEVGICGGEGEGELRWEPEGRCGEAEVDVLGRVRCGVWVVQGVLGE